MRPARGARPSEGRWLLSANWAERAAGPKWLALEPSRAVVLAGELSPSDSSRQTNESQGQDLNGAASGVRWFKREGRPLEFLDWRPIPRREI